MIARLENQVRYKFMGFLELLVRQFNCIRLSVVYPASKHTTTIRL